MARQEPGHQSDGNKTGIDWIGTVAAFDACRRQLIPLGFPQRLVRPEDAQHDGSNPKAGGDQQPEIRIRWRLDPITGHSALHTGLDFQADTGTPILAAASGVVTQEYDPEYGNMLEIDHGNDLVTRYAHASVVLVKKGDLIKRVQKIAEVGTTGRST